MTLKELLKKKDKIKNDENTLQVPGQSPPGVPEFKFIRSTTTTQEVITPPTFPGDAPPKSPEKEQRKSRFRKGSNASTNSVPEHESSAKSEHRFSSKLHLRHRSRTLSSGSKSGSENVPEDLPDVDSTAARTDEDQAKWEKRATLLTKGNSISRSPSTRGSIEGNSPLHSPIPEGQVITINLSDEGGDENIQEAIRLHEAGDYERATTMFGRLADPSGANHALSQVLYGLALRHGWGCTPNPELAVEYLSYAASNSADIEALALEAGMKKGGAAKGELVLAIFELANSFRNGWGVKKDPVAAKQYYETAANLGDTDAMNEVAWCYLEGFGCKKDKFKAAQYLRLAEEKGSKTLGNTWIWKEKYNPKT